MALDSRALLGYTIGTMKIGDLIIFCAEEVAGLVIARCFDDPEVPAVLVQFLNEPDRMPLHYYDEELEEWDLDGEIKIQHAT